MVQGGESGEMEAGGDGEEDGDTPEPEEASRAQEGICSCRASHRSRFPD